MEQSITPMDKIPVVVKLRIQFISLSLIMAESSYPKTREEITTLFDDMRRHLDAMEAEVTKLHHGF